MCKVSQLGKYRNKYSLNLLISSKLISDLGKEFNKLIVEV